MKKIAVLGSTGTIGDYTLEIVRKFPDKFQVVSLAAGANLKKLQAQVEEFKPAFVSSKEKPCLEACIDAADVVVVGIVGFAGLAPTLHAIRAGKQIALANKESLVVGGSLLKEELKKSKASLIPVDSEHNALFQLLENRKKSDIASIVLTASGGPLLRKPDFPLEDVTPEIAVAHPNWKMGPKISVDSATLMNKGLELIEAHYLFDFPEKEIEVWVHPQSIIHGAIWLTDNSCLAQLTKPDMKSSIGFAMSYPEKLPKVIDKLSFADMAKLEFFEPDTKRFPALTLARQALRQGPSHVIALNAANEVAVESFLQGKILFPKITRVVESVLVSTSPVNVSDLSCILQIDAEARKLAQQNIQRT